MIEKLIMIHSGYTSAMQGIYGTSLSDVEVIQSKKSNADNVKHWLKQRVGLS